VCLSGDLPHSDLVSQLLETVHGSRGDRMLVTFGNIVAAQVGGMWFTASLKDNLVIA
jgi:hypothetical protein